MRLQSRLPSGNFFLNFLLPKSFFAKVVPKDPIIWARSTKTCCNLFLKQQEGRIGRSPRDAIAVPLALFFEESGNEKKCCDCQKNDIFLSGIEYSSWKDQSHLDPRIMWSSCPPCLHWRLALWNQQAVSHLSKKLLRNNVSLNSWKNSCHANKSRKSKKTFNKTSKTNFDFRSPQSISTLKIRVFQINKKFAINYMHH